MDIVVNGRRLHAGTGGKDFAADSPVVVFVHGAGLDHTIWALQARYFAHRGRSVLALDLPGHGQSEGPHATSIAAMADSVLAALAALGVGKAALVGHSMGALVALEAAARGRDRVEALALLGGAAEMRVHPDLLAAASDGAHTAIDFMLTWGIGRRAQIGHHPAPGFWLTGAAMRLLERADPRVLAADLKACDDYRNAAAAAAAVACPTLLVVGSDDRMTPPARAGALAGMLNGASVRREILADTGHMMMVESPVATLAALKTFLG